MIKLPPLSAWSAAQIAAVTGVSLEPTFTKEPRLLIGDAGVFQKQKSRSKRSPAAEKRRARKRHMKARRT